MICARCTHDVALHGRRGHGACRKREITEAGRKAVEELREVDQSIRGLIIETALALPGMTTVCDCKRFKKTVRAAVNPDSLGSRVRALREQRAITLTKFAESVRLTKGHLSQLEHGKCQPTAPVIIRIAEALGCSTDLLLTGREPSEVAR